MRARRSLYNLITALGAQVITLFLGFLVPRLTLVGYGSETNGFMSLVNQVYAYIALLEAGLCTAEIQALYSPVAKNDRQSVSCIVNTARGYYKRLTGYFFGAILLVACVLPFAVESGLDPWTMIGYFLLFGVSRLANFWFVSDMRPLLQVEGKSYVSTNIDFVFSLCTTLSRILLLTLRVDLLVMQAVYSAINMLQIAIYYVYFKKKYAWIDRSVPADKACLGERKAYLLQQIGQLVFSCTDVIILSVFCNLKTTSIYSVYMLVFNALAMLVYKMASSAQFVLGQVFHESRDRYLSLHRAYEVGLVAISNALFTTAYLLILPFIKLYTEGVADADYLDSVLPLLFCLNELLSISKFVPFNLINVAGHAQKVNAQTVCEVVINLGVSLTLVPAMGIRGVLIGTLVALICRLVVLVRYANRNIMRVTCSFEVRLMMANLFIFGIAVVVRFYFPLNILSYGQFIVVGGLVFMGACILCGGVNLVLYRSVLSPYIHRLTNRIFGRK